MKGGKKLTAGISGQTRCLETLQILCLWVWSEGAAQCAEHTSCGSHFSKIVSSTESRRPGQVRVRKPVFLSLSWVQNSLQHYIWCGFIACHQERGLECTVTVKWTADVGHRGCLSSKFSQSAL